MSVEVSPISGIGIKFNRETLEKYRLKFVWEESIDSDPDKYFEEILENFDQICHLLAGSCYTEEYNFYLSATDPINNLDAFIEDLQRLGFEGISKKDLILIEDLYWW